MKKSISVLSIAFILIAAFGAPAWAYKQVFKFDLVTIDVKHLIEADGAGKVVIKFPSKISEAVDDVSTLQKLYNVSKPIFKDAKKKLVKKIKSTNKKLAKEPEKQKELTRKLNSYYKKTVKDTKKKARAAISNEWKRMQKENKALKVFKLELGLEITAGAFQVASGLAQAIASGGLSPRAYYKIAKGLLTMFKGVSKAYKTEAKARMDLRKAIESAQKKLDSIRRNVKDDKVRIGRITKWRVGKNGEALNGKLKVYANKLTGARKGAQKLARDLDEMIKNPPQFKNSKAQREYEKSVDALIKNIIALNQTVQAGKDMLNYTKHLSALMKKAKKGKVTLEELKTGMMNVRKGTDSPDIDAMEVLKKGKKALSSLKDFLETIL